MHKAKHCHVNTALTGGLLAPRPGPTQQPRGASAGVSQARQLTGGWGLGDIAPPISRLAA